ncbi:hypothetical protein B0H11DRAFT_1903595 [Mycena galericulata]|nr:hypothetical protein B0H11DRAFT_1903595 [Mycena galericulata]
MDTLIGKGRVNNIDWAWDWRGQLELNIFDPSLAGDTGKNFMDVASEEMWQHLKLIPFPAFSDAGIKEDNAVSSLLKAGIFDKVIGILERSAESGVQAYWQAASSTLLYLMIKSGGRT